METNIIYNGNCIDIMKECIEPGTIDLIYADPPFNLSGKGLNLKNNKTGGPFYEMNKDWDVWYYLFFSGFCVGCAALPSEFFILSLPWSTGNSIKSIKSFICFLFPSLVLCSFKIFNWL